MAQFEDGHAPCGREGRPNNSRTKNVMLRDLIRDFCIDKFKDYVQAFNELEPKDKCDEYAKMIQYVVPKITSVTFEEDDKATNAFNHLKQLAEYRKDLRQE